MIHSFADISILKPCTSQARKFNLVTSSDVKRNKVLHGGWARYVYSQNGARVLLKQNGKKTFLNVISIRPKKIKSYLGSAPIPIVPNGTEVLMECQIVRSHVFPLHRLYLAYDD